MPAARLLLAGQLNRLTPVIKIAIDDAAWASPWRRHRVGEKLFLSLGLVVSSLASPTLWGSLAVGVLSVAVVLWPARIRLSMLVHAMAAPLVFIAVSSLSVLFSVGANPIDPLFSFGFLAITPDSIQLAIRVVVKACCGSLAIMVLALTTPVSDILAWLAAHKVPGPLIEVAGLTYRLLFIFLSTAVSLSDAQKRRGDIGRVGLVGYYRRRLASLGSLTATLMVRSWDKARRLEYGLAARGAQDSLATTARVFPASWPLRLGSVAGLVVVWLVGFAPLLVEKLCR